MIHADRAAADAAAFLDTCTPLGASPERSHLCDLAVRRVIGTLFDGNTNRLDAWFGMQGRSDVEMADILHAACHAIARSFERDDRTRLGDALHTLDAIECHLTSTAVPRWCCHDHKLGVPLEFRRIA